MTTIRHTFAMLALSLLAMPALADKKAELAEEIAGHKVMAAAHRGAAECLQAGKSMEECTKAMEAQCKDVAAGPHCGMRMAKDEHKDVAKHQAKHARMAAAHAAAEKCLAAGKDMEACEKQLRADCRGLSINSHCGMKGHHH